MSNGQLFNHWAFAWWSNIEPLTDPFIFLMTFPDIQLACCPQSVRKENVFFQCIWALGEIRICPWCQQIKAENLWDVIWIFGTHCSACFKCLPWVTYYSNFNNPFTESGVLEQKNIQKMLVRAARNWKMYFKELRCFITLKLRCCRIYLFIFH